MLAVTMLLMTSCLNSDDDTELTNDAAITTFSLGTLDRYLHTMSSQNTDSTYRVALTGSNYFFHIDQINRRVYNTDSLPVGTDASKVLCTIGTLNNGLCVIKDVDSDTLRYYSSSDSIDFTQPRQFVVYSSDGSNYTEYTIHVNVHQEVGDEFKWTLVDDFSGDGMTDLAALAQMQRVKVAYWGEQFVVSGLMPDGTTAIYSWFDFSSTWGLGMNTIYPLPNGADVWKNIVVKGDYIFLLNGGKLWKMTTVLEKEYDTNLKQLIGATSTELYALSEDNRLMVSRNDGETWEEDRLTEDAAMLPAEDISFVCYPMKYAANTDYALIAGNRSVETYPQESIAMVWRKIVDDDEYTPEGFWTYIERSDNNQLALPRLQSLSLVRYDDSILALGGAGIGGSTKTAFSQIYQSRDNGITWKKNKAFELPVGFDYNATSVAMAVDANQCLWLFCGGTGQVWRGRLNRLGWDVH